MDAVHFLHDAICVRMKLGARLGAGERSVRKERLAYVQIDQRFLTEQTHKALAGAEGHGDGDHGLVILHRVFEHCLFQGSNVGIKEPHRALGEEVEPFPAFKDVLDRLVKLDHGVDAVCRDGNAARHTDKTAVGPLQVRFPCREVGKVRADRLEHADIVPIEHVIGDRYGAVFEHRFVLFEIFPAVDAQTVRKAAKGENDHVKCQPIEHAHKAIANALGEVRIAFIKSDAPFPLYGDHMLITAIRIFVGKVVSVIHKYSLLLIWRIRYYDYNMFCGICQTWSAKGLIFIARGDIIDAEKQERGV